MSSSNEVESFQVEVTKLGRHEVVELLVTMVRGLRGRRKLYGEAVMSDHLTPIIHFKVQHASDIEDLRDRFIQQLIHRGYLPLRFRQREDGKLRDWADIDRSRYDMSDLKFADEPATFTES